MGNRSYGGGIVKPIKASNSYMVVNLTDSNRRKQESVHVLVLQTFVGPRPKGLQCCHSDGDRSNNKLSNLRWDTPTNNHKDKHKHGTAAVGEKNPYAKLNVQAVMDIRANYKQVPVNYLAKKYGVSRSTIFRVIHNKSWTHV